ncbi:MAG: threonine aldolase [Chlamydiae bacterium CG10_big_fil_rev_8_21_14_0_10_42_34]|nr:MAG: threonine aldolase [Chlamydiae bacterium CG10_big_fil_rev_8_21_14_0_10_42_34]
MQTTFASDNFSKVHPHVLRAIEEANNGHAKAYGADPWTEKSEELFRKIFGEQARSFIVFNGTAANVTIFNHLLSSWQAVICPESAHVWTDECGAVQANTGCSLIPVKGENGKITPKLCAEILHGKGVEHHAQPAAISITQSTELGTVYDLDEIKQIGEFARQHDLIFHMDGARICNAAASLQVSLKQMTTDLGVDVLSFGGTKNGLMGAEAVVFLKQGLSEQFKYVRKQKMQLGSKMRFLSAQMIALLEDNLWLKNATHANEMAKRLEASLRRHHPNLEILYPVQANALFVRLPSMDVLQKLQKTTFFWIWDHKNVVARWMTSWDTDVASIDLFIEKLNQVLLPTK